MSFGTLELFIRANPPNPRHPRAICHAVPITFQGYF
jgi:hypothetical protein